MTARTTRVATLLTGLAVTAYGVLLLAGRGWRNLEAALTWLVGGVLLHDVVLAPATVVLGWAALRVARPERVRPWAVALVLLGPLTLLACRSWAGSGPGRTTRPCSTGRTGSAGSWSSPSWLPGY